jgi:carotenoid cleavage dioxygenase-like enzyme
MNVDLVSRTQPTIENCDHPYPKGVWVLELGIEPRLNAQSQDDGYLVSFVTDLIEDCSECVIIDATRAHGEDIRAAKALRAVRS